MKNQEATHSLAYSLPMIEATSPVPENFSQFYYDDDRLTFFMKLPEGVAISTETEEPKEDGQAIGDEMQDSADNGIERTNPAMSGQEMFFQESQNQLRWSVNRTQLGSHFLLKPAEDREDLFIPPRTIDPERPMVALTFDDGPHPKNTPRILEALRTYDGASTFFMVGTNVERYPDIVRQVAESGSEIASHTYDHPNLTKLSGDRLNYQLRRVNELIGELTDQQVSVKTLRPPYGAVSEQVREAADTPLILWSLDTLDWKTRNAQKTIRHVLEECGGWRYHSDARYPRRIRRRSGSDYSAINRDGLSARHRSGADAGKGAGNASGAENFQRKSRYARFVCDAHRSMILTVSDASS